MPFEPRPYQMQAVQAVVQAFQNGKRRLLLRLPTGAGKTVVSALLIENMLTKIHDRRILFLAHRKEIIDQTAEKIEYESKVSATPQIITQKMKKAFDNIGRTMPDVWGKNLLSQQQRKSLLRCLIDKVIIHRVGRDKIHTRIVWKGGDTTTTH